MIFILSKILLFLIKPIVWVFALLIITIFTKHKKKKQRFLIWAIVILFIFSNGFLSGKILNAYEVAYPKKQQYDVGIVLGGFSGFNKRNNQIQFGPSGDRLFQAVSLLKKGQIKKILLSSGNANFLDTTVKEADLALAYLKEIGIPESSVLLENQSRNTVENAKNSLALIQKYKADAKVLVITSAWHIPRARLIFDRQSKNKIEYYPTNYLGSTAYDFGDYILPNPAALGTWEFLFKEWIGLIVDRIRS